MVEIVDNTGDTPENAIIIRAKNSSEGVKAEYAYLERKYGRHGEAWVMNMQALITRDDRFYDELNISLANRQQKTYYFDITEFFGNNDILAEVMTNQPGPPGKPTSLWKKLKSLFTGK